MNCKPGDLAIVVGARSNKALIGSVVEVIKHIPSGELYKSCFGNQRAHLDDFVWIVRGRFGEWLHADHRLSPIRDQDGADEMIRIAGLPQEQGVKA